MEWPLEGYTEKKDGRGLVFSAKDNHYSSVWMVMLLPVKEGYGGMDLRSGFSWDTGKNELTLEKPVDTEKFSVYILGCD